MVAAPATSDATSKRHDLAPAPERDARAERRLRLRRQPGQPALIGRDQRERCRKRHLEARMHDRFRRDCQQHQSRHRDGAERQRRTVEHHPDQHDRGHDEGALGRDLGAGQQQIEGRNDQRCERTPFLDRTAACDARNQRKPGTHHKEHDARDHRHVITGNRQHMREARHIHRLVDLRGDGVALAGDQRGSDRALVARQARRESAHRWRRGCRRLSR